MGEAKNKAASLGIAMADAEMVSVTVVLTGVDIAGLVGAVDTILHMSERAGRSRAPQYTALRATQAKLQGAMQTLRLALDDAEGNA